MSSRPYLVALLPASLITAFTLALFATQPIKTADAAEYTVNIRDFNFNPASLTVRTGDVVRWENNGSAPHTSSSSTGIWDSGTINPGGVFSQQFATAGTFQYFCRIHNSMQGTIVVQGAPTTTSVPTASVTPVVVSTTPVASATPGPTSAAATATPVAPTPTPISSAGPPTNVPELWLLVLVPTPAYTMNGNVTWIAQPGEWYRVFDQDGAWALTIWELDTPYNTVWIEVDNRVVINSY